METLNLSGKELETVDESQQERRQKSGANWFYWIAGLSLVNSAIFLAGGEWSFFAGLAVTQVADALVVALDGNNDLTIVKAVAVVFDLMIAGVFALFGVFAHRGQNWAFLAGLALYLLDAIVSAWLEAWLVAGFHLFAGFMIFGGWQAARKLKNADSAPAF